jgi:phosphoribosylanthranilate isomerase
METRVKICGIARASDARAVAALQPDFLGFILWPGSKRFVSAAQLGEWARDLPSGIPRVGVFVDATPDEVRRAVDTAGLQIVQLHGTEAPASYRQDHTRLWKVVRVGEGTPLPAAEASVDAFLVDTYSPTAPGGTGLVGDWSAAAELVRTSRTPVVLAGGLTADNVAAAARAVRPWAVDVSSGVESAPGVKDLAKVREFIERCRTA